MIEDMYSIMTRIEELRSRFGLKRHNQNDQISRTADEVKSSYKQVSDRVMRESALDDSFVLPPDRDLTRSDINKLAESYAKRYDISPALVKAVINVESGYNTHAVSPKGARGLMQLMPSVAKDLGVSDPFNPEENIRGGVELLREHLENYNWDYQKALAAYNAGPGAVEKAGGRVPDYPETQDYVKKVINAYLENE